VIDNIRRLSRDLSPTILEDFGLSAALRWLVNHFAKNYNIKVNLDMLDIDSLLPRASHVAVYRTVQEALNNIGRHARAKTVSISIHGEGQRIFFSIEDDGIGFDAGKIARTEPDEKGLGLATMKGRAEMAGGVMEIWTEEGKGTRILMSFPLEQGETGP
jgi:signal transduction histidine kinase